MKRSIAGDGRSGVMAALSDKGAEEGCTADEISGCAPVEGFERTKVFVLGEGREKKTDLEFFIKCTPQRRNRTVCVWGGVLFFLDSIFL